MTISLLQNFTNRYVDYILAFSQAYIYTPIYLKTPPSFYIEGTPNEDYYLELFKNLYSKKTASKN